MQENDDGEEQDNTDDEEPDKFGSHTFSFFVTELALEAFTTNALSIAALTSVLTDASAPLALSLENRQLI